MLTCSRVVLAVTIAVLVLAGCAASGSGTHAAQSTAAQSPAASSPAQDAGVSHAACAAQLHAWQHGPGGRLLNKVQDDIGVLAKKQNVAQAQGPAQVLAADAQGAIAHLPPACIPGEAAAMTTSLHDYSAAASDVAAGNLAGARAQVKAAVSWLTRAVRDQFHWATHPGGGS